MSGPDQWEAEARVKSPPDRECAFCPTSAPPCGGPMPDPTPEIRW